MKYCHHCGVRLPDDARFCTSCGERQHVYAEQTPAPEQASAVDSISAPAVDSISAPAVDSISAPAVDSISAPTEQPKEKPFKKFVGKVTAFENKHNVIVNAIMLACAFIVALVALFAPIKVVAYDRGLTYGETDGDTAVTTGATVDQSIFQILGSVFYFNASDQMKSEAEKEYNAARDKAAEAYNKWINSHVGVSDEQRYNKHIELTAKYLSDVNYFGIMFMQITDDNILDGSGVYINALLTVFLGWAVAVLAVIMAVMSVVQLIFAIINMAKKKPQTNLYKYFTTMLGLSTAGLSLMCCAPMFKASGGMLAIALLIGLVFLACGVIGGLLKGTHYMLIIKRGICASVALIGYFVLFTEVFALVSRMTSEQANAVSGYGLFRFVEMIIYSVNAVDPDSLQSMTESAAVGAVMYILVAMFLVTFASAVFKRSLRRLALGDEVKKTNYSGPALTTAIFATVIIILGLAATVDGVKWICRGSIYACLLFMLAVFIFDKVFLPNDKIKGKEQPEPAPEGTAQPEQASPMQNNLQQPQDNYLPDQKSV